MITERKVVLYISMSLDGYIATEDNNLGFLSIIAKEGEDYGYNDFVKTTDTIIIGRKTYDKVLAMGYDYPHTDKDVYIITRKEKPAVGSFHFYNGDLKNLVLALKKKKGKNIYCDGGAEIANELMMHNLIDDFIISVIPILLGNGIKLFKNKRPEQILKLITAKTYSTGLTQLHYERVANTV